MDLVIRQAAIPEKAGLWDVAIEGERIAVVASRFEGNGKREIKASGDLLSPGFVDAHVHLDKNLIGEDLPFFPTSSLAERIEIARKVQWEMARQSVKTRAINMIRLALSRGTTTLRTHADIDPVVGLKNFEAVREVKEEFSHLMDIQIVAFPQSGILRAPGTSQLLRQALEEGADVIGGIDPGGFDGDIQRHIDLVFDLAQAFNVDIDIHLHDPGHLGTFTLRRIADMAISSGLEGRVMVGHAFCLGEVAEDEANRTIQRLSEAQISIVSAPQSSRQLPPAPKLLDMGVNVLCASDNVRDAWSPFGNADMLERALLVAYKFSLRTEEELASAFRMVTHHPARALRIEADYGIEEGKPADLVLLQARSPKGAIISQSPRLAVIKRGCVMAENGRLVEDLRSKAVEVH